MNALAHTTLTFNTLFNHLHNTLTRLLDTAQNRDFYSCLSEIRDRAEHSPLFDRLYDQYGNDLRTLNSIRNILIHKNDWIVIPKKTLDVLKNAKEGIEHMEYTFHKKAGDIFGKNIFIAKESDNLADVLSTMALRSFSHVPVYTDKEQFRGVLSLNSLLYWMTNNKNTIDTNIPIGKIRIDTKKSEYLFIRSDTPVSAIEGYFREYSKKRKKLGAIFLTDSGETKSAILGIVTAWDLPTIYEQAGK